MSTIFNKTWAQAALLARNYPYTLSETYKVAVIPVDKLGKIYTNVFIVSAIVVVILAIFGFCGGAIVNSRIICYLMLTPLPFLLSVMIYGAFKIKQIRRESILSNALSKDIKIMSEQPDYLRLPERLEFLNNVIKLHAACIGDPGHLINLEHNYFSGGGPASFAFRILLYPETTVNVFLKNFLNNTGKAYFKNGFKKAIDVDVDDFSVFYQGSSSEPLRLNSIIEKDTKTLILKLLKPIS